VKTFVQVAARTELERMHAPEGELGRVCGVSATYKSLDPRIPGEVPVFVSEWHNKLANEVAVVIKHQWKYGIKDGIKGYIFYGEPGTGKTWTAFKVAEILGLLELRKKYMLETVIFRDCADLASWRYGETEKEIRNVFKKAYENAEEIKKRKHDAGVLIIFDDAEGLFLTRSYGSKLDTWYIAQLNVFFHEIDAMDTSKLFVILTTNRIDLLDEALKDRFVTKLFPLPEKEVLLKAAESKLMSLQVNDHNIIEEVKNFVLLNTRTFRDVNRIVTQKYIEWLIKKYEL
jgi:SpoVK/Ycf46/Vps4 family AAA+-type ATPase